MIAFALVVAIGLGYLKFVRGRGRRAVPPSAAPVAAADIDEAEVAGLAARVAALEARAAAAAAALGGSSGEARTAASPTGRGPVE